MPYGYRTEKLAWAALWRKATRWFMRLFGDDTGLWRDSCQKWNTTICSKKKKKKKAAIGILAHEADNMGTAWDATWLCACTFLILSINVTRAFKEGRWALSSQARSRDPPPLPVLGCCMGKTKTAEDTTPSLCKLLWWREGRSQRSCIEEQAAPPEQSLS